MTGNTFGNFLKLTTWGESHGIAIGGVLDGVPAGIQLSEEDIQPYLDKRKPGQANTSARSEEDKIQILSGVFEGKTTGTAIAFMIYNKDHKSDDYSAIKDLFRPGHADYTYFKKYGIRDYRGGGRASARETAMRVAGGAIAKKIIPNIKIEGKLIEVGGLKENWEELLEKTKREGNSVGAIIEITAKNVPTGLGEPVFNKLNAEIAGAMMGINAVKAVEIGDGVGVAKLKGSENCDEMIMENGKIKFLSNHAGGILGGISTGQDIIVRITMKPTSSIAIKQKTITTNCENTEISTNGRHDVCVGIRAVPVAEAMLALVLADFYLINKAGQWKN